MIRNKRGFLTLLGLVFTLAIMCWLFYILMNTYFKRPALNEALREQNGISQSPGTNASNYQSIKESTKKKIEDINKQHLKDLENLNK